MPQSWLVIDLEPYPDSRVQTLELIDPLVPDLDRYVTPDVWSTFKDLREVDFDNCQEHPEG